MGLSYHKILIYTKELDLTYLPWCSSDLLW